MTFHPDWLADPRVFSVNRLEPVSDHDVFRTAEEADAGASSLVRSLDGVWRAHFARCPKDAPRALLADPAQDESLREITVPCVFQLEHPAWDPPHYTNVQYPWDGLEPLEPPQVSDAYNPTVTAVRTFSVTAEDVACGRAVLTFGAVEAAAEVYLNGVFIGYAEDSFTPHRFDVTSALRPGENRLAVRVYKRCSGSWLEDQDFWRFSGIHRSVTLTFEPRLHLEDVFVRTPLSQDYTCAALHLTLRTRGEGTAEIALRGDDGALMLQASLPVGGETDWQGDVPGAALWSAEQPTLYTLTITLRESGGAVAEVARLRVGFRQFEMIDRVMCLNGKRIVFRGVNRHEFDCDRGRVMTPELLLQDVRDLKGMNVNAVRTSHYPNHPLFYRLCDQYGLYVIDETNVETHGTWGFGAEHAVPASRPEWRDAVLDRGRSMLERDKNHPCILLWSCGNESWVGEDLLALANFFRRRDPTRLVHYEGCSVDPAWADTTDVYSRMYFKAADIEAYLRSDPPKPFINCEYTHAMGNSCGGMHLYTALEDRYPMYQGGFIWDYVDQALRVTLPDGRTRLAYGGDFGDRPTDWQFNTNGIILGDRSFTPKVQEVRYLYQDVQLIPDETGVTVRSRRIFASVSGCAVAWQLEADMTPVASGLVDLPDLPAGQQMHLPLSLGPWPAKGLITLTCRLLVRRDPLLAPDWPLAVGQSVLRREAPEHPVRPCAPAPVLGSVNLGVHGEGLSALISRSEGLISLKDAAGGECMLRAPMLSLFRAPTDNDRGNRDALRQGVWHAVSRYSFVRSDEPVVRDGCTEITFHYEPPVLPGTDVTLTYAFRTKDAVEITLRWPGVADQPDLPALGVAFQLDPRLHRVVYDGLGPDDTYADRRCGAVLGRFAFRVEDALVRYAKPQECGNRMDVRRFRITDDDGRGLMVEGDALEISALPWLPEELAAAYHPDELSSRARTVLDVALFRRGVGGDDSWGAPVLPPFTHPSSTPYTLRFTLRAL